LIPKSYKDKPFREKERRLTYIRKIQTRAKSKNNLLQNVAIHLYVISDATPLIMFSIY